MKKALSLLFVFVLLLGIMPQMTMTAWAKDASAITARFEGKTGGNADQKTTVDWLNGKDLTFSYIGADGQALNNCSSDDIQVWENGIPGVEWELGTIAYANGLNRDSTTRLRTVGYLNLSDYSAVQVTTGYTLVRFVYDKDFHLLSATDWLGSGVGFSVTALQTQYPEGIYFRMALRALDSRTLTLGDISASGITLYAVGEEIPEDKCDWGYEDLGSIGSWQDGAIWDSNLFVLDSSSRGAVYDLESLEKLATFTLDNKEILNPHANSVCFGSTYYVEGDKYPLLYVNIYNNYASSTDRMEGTCCVYRVMELDGTFTTELVQVIRIGFVEDLTLWKSKENNEDTRPYGNFAVDTDNGKLYAFVMRDANKTTRFFRFALPDLTEGTYNEAYDCNVVTLDTADIEAQFDTVYFNYLQGCIYYGGKIISAEGFGSGTSAQAALRIVDLQGGTLEKTYYTVEAGLTKEPEVVCVDTITGKVYYAAADGVLCVLNLSEVHTHTYTSIVTVPACRERGYTTYTCTACGDSYRTPWLDKTAYEGKTIACVGDSITAAYGVTKDETDYVTLLAGQLGMDHIRLGDSGTTLCTDGSRTCNIRRLTEDDLQGADVVTIAMGINDFCNAAGSYYQLGDINSTDTSTIYGAARMWCERIAELRKTDSLSNTQFYFVTPVITSWNNSVNSAHDWDQSKTNIHGYTLRDLCNAMIEIAALYEVSVIDLNLLSGMYYVDAEDNNTAVFGGDGVHPGVKGHEMMASALVNVLLQNDSRDDHTHTFGSWITTTWPSCAAGEQQRVCTICSAAESRMTEPNSTHTHIPAITEPTCTEQGYTTYTCECGDRYVDDYTDAAGHSYANSICTSCGAVQWDSDKLYNAIPVVSGQLIPEDCSVIESDIYSYVVNCPLKKGHVLSISDTDYVFSVRRLVDGNYITLLKQATTDSFTATEDMTVAMLIRKPDKSALTAEELASIVIYDSQYGMIGVEGSVKRFAVEAETIDGGTATTRAAIFLPESYSESGTPTRLIVMTNGYSAHLTDSVWNKNTADNVGIIRNYLNAGYAVYVVDNTAGRTSQTPDIGCPQLVSSYREAYEYIQQSFNVEEKFSIHSRSFGTFAAVRLMQEIPELIKCAVMTGPRVSVKAEWPGLDKAFIADRFGFADTTGATYEADKMIGHDPYTDVDRDSYTLPPTYWAMSKGDATTKPMEVIEKLIAHGNDVTSVTHTGTDHTGVCTLNTEKMFSDALAFLNGHQEEVHIHTYASNVTLPTCTEQGYTTYTCECGDRYVDDYTDAAGHRYVNGVCTACGTAHANLANYEGKVISILGDSISTFAGYIPTADGFNLEHLARYPQDNLLTDVNETWWMQVISTVGAKLGINDSWRGATVSGAKPVTTGSTGENAAMGNLQRIRNLGANGTPDVILFYGGTNDLAHVSKVGTFDGANAPAEVDLTATKWDNLADGYVHTLLRLQYFYPDAQIVAMLPTYTNGYYSNEKLSEGNAVLAAICEHYGVTYVDLRECGISTANLPDNIHPDATGMDYITVAVVEALLNEGEVEAGENVVHVITHKLTNAESSMGYYKGVTHGKSFEARITGEDVKVTVTMGGADITDTVYSNSVIAIAEVTGDIVISAEGRAKPVYEDHLQQLPEGICSGTNLWAALEHDEQYYTATGWGIHSSGTVSSVTFPVSAGDCIYATSFGAAGKNGGNINGIRVTWFDANGVLESMSADAVYAEFSANGYLSVPEGAVVASVPMWKVSDDNELSILNREHSYTSAVTAPTCTERGYTTHTCACGDSYVDTYVDATGHSYSGTVCTVCGAEHPEVEDYSGKVISILSASTSTFAGYIPTADGFNLEHRARYPQDNLLTDVNETWWMQVINELDAKLGINDSWAGSQVLNTQDTNSGDLGPDAAMASLTRIQNLGSNGTPDLILFYGGGNDMGRGVTLGSFDPVTAPVEVDLTTKKWESFADAYVAALMRLQYFYPDTEIVVMMSHAMPSYVTSAKLDKYGPVIKAICEHYGVKYVELLDCGIAFDMLPDNIHPNAEGMDYITEDVLDTLLNQVDMAAGEHVVHTVTHNLIGAQASLGHYKGVSHGKPFEEIITGEELTVTVTMGGTDITASCCADGVITIAEVTGDLIITARAKFNADGHLQQLPAEFCAGTNLWTTLEPENIYYTASGWGNTSSGTSWSVTFPVEAGDRIWATSIGAYPGNGSSANGVRVTWFDENGVLETVSRDVVYAEFAANGYLTAPEGAVALNLPMTNNRADYEVYILSAEHSYTTTITAPTCTEQGYTTYTCACGDSYVDTYVDALGHDYSAGLCTVCGEDTVSVSLEGSIFTLTGEFAEGTRMIVAGYDGDGRLIESRFFIWQGNPITEEVPNGETVELFLVDNHWSPLRQLIHLR